MSRRSTRRQFLQQTALTGAGFWVAGGLSLADNNKSPNERINIACIGVGGKGSSDTDGAGRFGSIVALCDIDDKTLNAKAARFPNAKKYNDFRKMLEEMDKTIDAVTVSTADHTHAPASIMAMKMKKHVYCQKPLTHTVLESRQMREVAKKMGVCTQMGNQGSAENGLRRAVEFVQAGALGAVREIHVWTNRPVWPQAPNIVSRPKSEEPPPHVHWDLWLGPAPERPYSGVKADNGHPYYHDFNWRGWWDFGTGALGDMACHTANMAYRAAKLGYPTSVVADATDVNRETYPSSAKVTFQFPARSDLPPVTFVWYEGKRDGKKVLPPENLLKKVLRPTEKLADSGSLMVCDNGILFSPNDYGAQYRLLGDGLEEKAKAVPETLPRNGKGDDGMKEEWVRAIKEGKPEVAYSNFDIAAMLTESILLGNVAIRLNGEKLEWDGPNLKFTNNSAANKYLHYEYRKGWTL